MGTNGGLIEGVGLNIGNGAFTVDRKGNVVIQKGSISWGAVTGTGEIDQRIPNAQNTANRDVSNASDAHPSLRTKRIQGTTDLFECSVNMDIRIIWYYEGDKMIILVDLGHHDVLKQF